MEKQISNHAAVGKLIRAYMKENGIKGRVNGESYAGGNSVRVKVENMLPEEAEKLEVFCKQFEYGHFDGMIDLYEYSNVREDIPQVKFVFVRNEMNAELAQKIYEFVKGYCAGMEGAPEKYEDAHSFYNKQFQGYASNLVYRFFKGGYGYNEYYEFAKEAA